MSVLNEFPHLLATTEMWASIFWNTSSYWGSSDIYTVLSEKYNFNQLGERGKDIANRRKDVKVSFEYHAYSGMAFAILNQSKQMLNIWKTGVFSSILSLKVGMNQGIACLSVNSFNS